MHEITPYFFHNAPQYDEKELYYNHDNLLSLQWEIAPVIDSVEESLSLLCKADVDIKILTINSYKKTLFEHDQIGVKLTHLAHPTSLTVFLPLRFIREIIAGFLNADFSKKEPWIPFSSTEKGILAFIFSQLFFDLEKIKPTWTNGLIIENIFSAKDIDNLVDTSGYPMAIDLSFSYKNHQFLGRILAPQFETLPHDPPINTNDLLDAARHFVGRLTLVLKECLIPINVLRELRIGDVILFDSCSLKMMDEGLLGKIHASFGHLLLWIDVSHEHGDYFASLEGVAKPDEVSMKRITIAEEVDVNAVATEEGPSELSQQIASSVRVPLSVEIASVPLSLKKICQLRKEDIIDLNRKITDPLNLVIDGKIIGQAMPIQIGDRLGIKITMINAYEN